MTTPHTRKSTGGTRITRTADRLARRPMLLGAIVFAVGAFLLVVGFLATTGPPFQSKYRLQVSVPADAPIMRVGQSVRVGGRLAGLISDVQPDRQHDRTTITANITKTAFRPLPEDTKAYVRVHSIVYETYLELRPGTAEAKLGDGDTVKGLASSGVDLLEAVKLFDRKSRDDLRRATAATGFGLAARGAELNAALKDTPELARDVSAQLGAATREPGALARVVAGSAVTASALRGRRPDDVSGLIGSAGEVLAAVDRRGDELRRSLRLVRPVEDRFLAVAPEAEPLLDDIKALAHDARPAVRDLNATLPVVNHLLDRGEPLRTDVDRIADVADPVLTAGRPVGFELFPVMTTLGPLNADLKTLLERVGPYRKEYRIPGQPGVKKGSGEISEAGRRFIDATNDPYPGGLAPGAPAWRTLPVLTPRPCQNPFPLPGQADHDTMKDGKCVKGGTG